MNKLEKILIPIILGLLLVFIGMVNIVAGDGNSMHTYWNDNNGGHWNIDQYMWVEQKTPNTFWAAYWLWEGNNYGGYIGLMTPTTAGDTALFSLWNANGASGANCGIFGGEGVGYHCSIEIPINTYTIYKFRIWRLDSDANGQWWGAWVNDKFIGSIRVNSSNTLISGNIIDFTEYPDSNQCKLIPSSTVVWSQPVFDNGANRASYGYFDSACNGTVEPATYYRSVGI
jgi:hypothetical protein